MASRLVGGQLYESYGIGPTGRVDIVRPDGYVRHVAPLEGVDELEKWFAGISVREENVWVK